MNDAASQPIPYRPHPLLRNNHVQSILSGTGLRKRLLKRRHAGMLAASKDILLDCGAGTRLLGHYSEASGGRNSERGLVTLIHGWEGSSESAYILSLGGHLHQCGYSIFRLNLRDHGPTHHLNRELFNSTRLSDVLGAMDDIQRRLQPLRHYLAGFSLGGNFALRVAADQADHSFRLDHAIAICPVIHPPNTMLTLETGWRFYHDYFMYKWKRSLAKKSVHFPEHDLKHMLAELKTLREMNRYFVPNFTAFDDTDSYLAAYSLTGDRLNTLTVPSHLITSADDPVILVDDIALIDPPASMTVEITPHGGHCAFMEGLQLNSWIDRRAEQILNQCPAASR